MSGFKPVSSQVDFSKLEEEILEFWKEDKTFEKSVKKEAPNGSWNFLDGPPFITGLPHYGTLLSSIPKDIFPRYWTMKGYSVRRVWGWDCHGLPAENKVEEQLGITRKKDIEEKVGVKKFIDACKTYVNNVSSEWEWYVDHIGRWVDFKNSYRTMDLNYMETVMWVFKQMYDKKLVYKGLRVSLFCPHCSTPISNFEVAMDQENYKELIDAATTYQFPIKGEENTYILAWSTTPWNKLVTAVLAVHPKLDYVKVRQGDKFYILAKPTLKMLKEGPKWEIVEEYKGSELLGKKYVPSFDYYPIEPGKKAFEIVAGDFVTAEEGTGVVTIAPYGEEDLKIMQEQNIHIELHVDEEGMIKNNVPKFGGMYYLKANKAINEDLATRGFIYKDEEVTHSVPLCWRCHTRLFHAPQNAWYVNVQNLKEQMKKTNEEVNWFPKHFKKGRFLKSLEAAPDWNISRSRYWGSPVPVWECECGERFVPGSIAELEEKAGKKIIDLHKPGIDEVVIKCEKCGQNTKRVPEVLDSWIEAGSACFAERHYPFNSEIKIEEFFPPDFIVEYTGQIRAWFYVLHVIANALHPRKEAEDNVLARNVLVTGVILGTDGRKMSKNFNNYPDPKVLLNKFGGDALRLYLMGVPVMKGEDINFSEEGVAEEYRFLLVFWNTYKFFTEYANLANWKIGEIGDIGEIGVLDRWILARLAQLNIALKVAYEAYNTNDIAKNLKDFIINDFSTWYIRRSRDRVSPGHDVKDKNCALKVMYEVLTILTKLAAPLIPFVTEEMYRNLTGKESVHLEDYPEANKNLIDEDLIRQMSLVRQMVEIGHAQRKEANIKLRQPLQKFTYSCKEKLSEDLEKIMGDELNVKQIEYILSTTKEPTGKMDIKVTQELAAEGEIRELIRQVQQLRKESGLTLKDKIKIISPNLPKENKFKENKFIEILLKQTNATEAIVGDKLSIIVVDEQK